MRTAARREYGQRHLEGDYRFLEDGRRLTDTGWRSRPPAPRPEYRFSH